MNQHNASTVSVKEQTNNKDTVANSPMLLYNKMSSKLMYSNWLQSWIL